MVSLAWGGDDEVQLRTSKKKVAAGLRRASWLGRVLRLESRRRKAFSVTDELVVPVVFGLGEVGYEMRSITPRTMEWSALSPSPCKDAVTRPKCVGAAAGS